MSNWYVSSVGWTAVTAWAASTAYSVGDLRRQLATPSVGNERVFRCTTAGTSGGSEPSWNLGAGATTTDNTAVWTEVTGAETYQSPGAWNAPFAKLQTPFAMSSKAVAGDNVYVASNHAQTQASALTISPTGTTASPNTIICIDETGTGHVPPSVSADLKTTAFVNTTGSGSTTIIDTGVFYCYGITFRNNDGTFGSSMSFGTSAGTSQVYENCNYTWIAPASFVFGSSGVNRDIKVKLINPVITLAGTGQSIYLRGLRFSWIGGSVAGTIPTKLFYDDGNMITSDVYLEGVDLSAAGSGKTIVGDIQPASRFFLKDCKLNSAVTVATSPTKHGYAETYVSRSDSTGKNNRQEKHSYPGVQTTERIVVRTSGASDGTDKFSVKIVTATYSTWVQPFEGLPIAVWNGTTAANVACTIEGIWNAAALPNNDDVWFDIEYMGTSGNPMGSFKTGTKADIFAANGALSASTEAWDSQATARANSTAYSVGDIFKVASNPGRIFFCTTAGTTAGSEPGGYATAVDGGSVTDNTATFRAAVRFKKAVTLTSPQPQNIGYIYAYPKAAAASSTFYIDPLITLS